jgi:membrane-associated phospholipid phosphatase
MRPAQFDLASYQSMGEGTREWILPAVATDAAQSAATTSPAARGRVADLVYQWSPSEWTALVFLCWFLILFGIAAALPAGLPEAASWIAGDSLMLGGVVVLGSVWKQRNRRSQILRQTYALFIVLPFAYKQAGAFGTSLAPSVESWLIAADRHVFGMDWLTRHPPAPGAWTAVFEGAYLSNHPLLLLAFALAVFASPAREPLLRLIAGQQPGGETLHTKEQRARRKEELLLSVCGSMFAGLLLAYAFYPLLPAVTPRLYFVALRQPHDGLLHNLNWWILDRFSIPWGIFPSGHVSGIAAIAFAFHARKKKYWAYFFALAAVMIAIATVWGNYHFISDAVAGCVAGASGWYISERLLRQSLRQRRPIHRQS